MPDPMEGPVDLDELSQAIDPKLQGKEVNREKFLRDQADSAVTAPKLAVTDPAMTPFQLAESQVHALMDAAVNQAVEKLRKLRDEIDETMRALQEHTADTKKRISDSTDFYQKAGAFRDIVESELKGLRESFQMKEIKARGNDGSRYSKLAVVRPKH